MSNIPADRQYTRSHEWLRTTAVGDLELGISDHAQHALGDLVFVEVPEVGRELAAGEACAVVESVKAASEVYAPVGGEIVAVNDKVVAEPGVVNAEPTGKGWLFKMKVGNPAELNALLDELAYKALTD